MASSCKKKPGSAEKQDVAQENSAGGDQIKEEKIPEPPLHLDLYGDPLPKHSIGRLGSTRMQEPALVRMQFAKDGTALVSTSKTGLAVWDPSTGQKRSEISIAKAAFPFALSRDGKTAAVATLENGILLSTLTGKAVAEKKEAHEKTITDLCFLKENTIVSTSDDRSIAFWNTENANTKEGTAEPSVEEFSLERHLRGDWAEVTTVACDTFGRLIVWGDSKGGVYWLDNGIENWSLSLGSASKAITDLTISSDGSKVAAASLDGTISIWPRTDNGEPGRPVQIRGHDGGVASIQFAKSNQTLFSTGGDKYFREWNTQTGALVRSHEFIDALTSQNFVMSPDESTIASWGHFNRARGVEKERFWLWDGKTGAAKSEPERHQGKITAVIRRDAGSVSTAGLDGTVRTWAIPSGKLVRTNRAAKGPVNALFQYEKALYFGGKDSRVRREEENGRVFELFDPVGGEITALAAYAGRLYTGDETGKVWAFGLRSKTRMRDEDNGFFSQVNDIAISPKSFSKSANGEAIVIAGSNSMLLVTNGKGQLNAKLNIPDRSVLDLEFSPDGTMLAAATVDYNILLWSTQPYAPLKTFAGHDGVVTSVAFSPDGTLLASGSNDSKVLIWDLATGETIQTLTGHKGAVNDVAFSSDGSQVISVSDDGSGLVWQLSILKR